MTELGGEKKERNTTQAIIFVNLTSFLQYLKIFSPGASKISWLFFNYYKFFLPLRVIFKFHDVLLASLPSFGKYHLTCSHLMSKAPTSGMNHDTHLTHIFNSHFARCPFVVNFVHNLNLRIVIPGSQCTKLGRRRRKSYSTTDVGFFPSSSSAVF